MKYSRQVLLKDGTPCLIRSGGMADAKAAWDCFNRTHEETDNLLSYADENTYNVTGEGEFLVKREASDKTAELCAFVGGRLVGMAGIGPVGEKDKVRHRAEFGISIERKWWGKGIGNYLTESCIECARAAGYLQVELEVVADNAAAVALYEKYGFTEYGRNPRGFRKRDGEWQELVQMRLEL